MIERRPGRREGPGSIQRERGGRATGPSRKLFASVYRCEDRTKEREEVPRKIGTFALPPPLSLPSLHRAPESSSSENDIFGSCTVGFDVPSEEFFKADNPLRMEYLSDSVKVMRHIELSRCCCETVISTRNVSDTSLNYCNLTVW